MTQTNCWSRPVARIVREVLSKEKTASMQNINYSNHGKNRLIIISAAAKSTTVAKS